MPIRRAGPFASDTASNLDEPTVLDGAVAPVNCNRYASSQWGWGAVFVPVQGGDPPAADINFITGTSYSKQFTLVEESNVQGIIVFYYQAAQSWSFSSSSYEVEVNGPSQTSIAASFEVFVNGVGAYADADDNISSGGTTVTITGNINSIVFPAATVPVRVVINIQGATDTGSPTLNANIQLGLLNP